MINSKRFISIFSSLKVADAAAVRRDIKRLIALADHASCVRRFDIVKQCAVKLEEFPLPAGVAEFYTALTLPRDTAERLLTRVVGSSSSPDRYKARALTNVARLHHDRGEREEGLRLYYEARKISREPLVDVVANRMSAVVKSIYGDHDYALRHLESNLAAIRAATKDTPFLFLDYLNSYAVELSAVGRLDEARRVSEFVVASPLSVAYPEWRETLAEIRRKSGDGRPASVAVLGLPSPVNVVQLASRASLKAAISNVYTNDQPARILSFEGLGMVKRKQPETKIEHSEATIDKQIALLRMITDPDRTLDPKVIEAITAILDRNPSSDRLEKIIKIAQG